MCNLKETEIARKQALESEITRGSIGSQEGSCVADVTHGAVCGSG